MKEQEAVLFLNEETQVWELVTGNAEDPDVCWKIEANALRDLAADGWEIEGPFRTCPKVAGLLKVWFVGYGLRRRVQ
jgi:hypothetical protein